VHVRAADDRNELSNAQWAAAENGADLAGAVVGRWIAIRAGFEADVEASLSPVLLELVVSADTNAAPDCAFAVASVEEIWPPNGRMVAIDILGAIDPDGDAVEYTIMGIHQDEPLEPASVMADARGIGTRTAYVRAARDGKGNGRVYTISYRAADGRGAECVGQVTVCVPHDLGRGRTCVDDGARFDSTAPVANKGVAADNYPNPFNPSTTIRFTTPTAAPVQLVVYNALGQHVRTLANGYHDAGTHVVLWDGRDRAGREVATGVYVYRLRAGSQEITNRMLLMK
jgi:hypothetical protein